MTCVGSPLPAPVILTGCNICPQTCSVMARKRTVEVVQLTMPWFHRLPQPAGLWSMKKVAHTVKLDSGASLTHPQYDPTLTYSTSATVSYGSRYYTAAQNVPTNQYPVTVSGNNTAYWTDSGANADLYLALDTDKLMQQWVNQNAVATYALAGGGDDGTNYRVEVMATFRDCEGHEIQLWDCIAVEVKN